MANFYEKGYLLCQKELSLSVDKACSLILEPLKHNTYRLFVADLTQTNQTIHLSLTIDGKEHRLNVSCKKGITSEILLQ